MKRQFIIIPLLLVSFYLFLSPKVFACDCTAGASRTVYPINCPSGFTCKCVGGPSVTSPYTCTETPIEEQNDIGGSHQPCGTNQTCKDGFTCITPRGTGPICVTEDEKNAINNRQQVTAASSSGPQCESGASGIQTAIGCIPIPEDGDATNSIFSSIFKIITGLGGGIALALMLYGVFIITTSAGIPDKLNAGKEIITSAIVGLIFILISVFLVRLIGVSILGIPGLS
ncbi:MAG TPA: pilin [Spirochaetia bacterium]|nr:pilin [Spirochaetia bacterium]